MKKQHFLIGLILSLIIVSGLLLLMKNTDKEWIIEEIHFKARDGFPLSAYYLRPKDSRKRRYPAVACLHQLWGNRDDFLKLFPKFADAGIVAIAPNFPRQRAGGDIRRITDLADAVRFLGKQAIVNQKKLGIITASFSLETGLMAIKGNRNVIADVMISGPVLTEGLKKWLTQHTDLAIFPITSLYDQKPGYPPHHHLLMEECLARNVNPHSRSLFIDSKENPYSIYAHGTFVFDEYPPAMDLIVRFFCDVFSITHFEKGVVNHPVPDYMVYFNSTDGFPVGATLRIPDRKKRVPAVILYPPQYYSRTFYQSYIYSFISRGIAVLIPNIKRTCREKRTLHLCDKEISGAVEFLKGINGIDHSRIGILFPSFYYLAAEELLMADKLEVRSVAFMDAGPMNYGVDPVQLKKSLKNVRVIHIGHRELDTLPYLFAESLR